MILLIISIIVIALIAIDSNKNRIQPAAMTAKQLQSLEKQKTKQEKENARIQAKQEKQQQQKQQAQQDIPFYDIQLERLYITVEDTRQQYKNACDSVNHDFSMNKHGAVIKGKVVNQHIAARDKALKKLITLENQIHALEKKKAQAENLLKSN